MTVKLKSVKRFNAFRQQAKTVLQSNLQFHPNCSCNSKKKSKVKLWQIQQNQDRKVQYIPAKRA
jgi:hypothetical protein